MKYEITVAPVQAAPRRLVVDTINAVGIYLAGDVLPKHLPYIERELRAGNGCDVLGFDLNVHVRIVPEVTDHAVIPRRDYGVIATPEAFPVARAA